MATFFLKSNAVEVFPSGYRSDNFVKSRSMIEENFVNLTKFTDDQYRNFAFQDGDNVIVNISGYRFSVIISELYNTLFTENNTSQSNLTPGDIWTCFLYIKFAGLHPELNPTYGNVLSNLDKRNSSNIEQLDDLDVRENETKFYGLGITRDANDADLLGASYIKLIFKYDQSASPIHTLQTKFLSISSYNLRDANLDYNLNERFDTRELHLNNVNIATEGSTKITSTFTTKDSVKLTLDNSLNTSGVSAGTLGFRNSGEVSFFGETDNECAMRLSVPGSSTAVSAGIKGPGSDNDTSVKIIYRVGETSESYLKLPKEPDVTATHEDGQNLVWVKTIDKRTGPNGKCINNWISLNDIKKEFRDSINDSFTANSRANDAQLNDIKDAIYGEDRTSNTAGLIYDVNTALNVKCNAVDKKLTDIKAAIYGADGTSKTAGLIYDVNTTVNRYHRTAFYGESPSEADIGKFNESYKDGIYPNLDAYKASLKSQLDEYKDQKSADIKADFDTTSATISNNLKSEFDTYTENVNSIVAAKIQTIADKISDAREATKAANTAANTATDAANSVAAATETMTAQVNGAVEQAEQDVQAAIDRLTSILNEIQVTERNFVKKAYPIGSIFMSTNSADPNEQLGMNYEEYPDEEPMEWRKIPSGRYLMADDFSSSDPMYGGSSTIKLTEANIPKHRHPEIYAQGGNISGGAYGDWVAFRSINDYNNDKLNEETKDTLNYSEALHSGYTDDIYKYHDKTRFTSHNVPAHSNCKTPRQLYTGTNLNHGGKTVSIPNNPLYVTMNMWIRIK